MRTNVVEVEIVNSDKRRSFTSQTKGPKHHKEYSHCAIVFSEQLVTVIISLRQTRTTIKQ
jgi:hypothetical protein